MTFDIRVDLGTIIAVFLALVLFGSLYDRLVGWMESKGYTEGFLSLIVAAGVLVTLVGISILSIEAALLAMGGFIATGTPMIIGSIIRYVAGREAAKINIRNEATK